MSAAEKQDIQYKEMCRRAFIGEPYVPWPQDFSLSLDEFMALIPWKINEDVAHKWFFRTSMSVESDAEVFAHIENFDNLHRDGSLGYVLVPAWEYNGHSLIILEERD